jgi:hypothetical protein
MLKRFICFIQLFVLTVGAFFAASPAPNISGSQKFEPSEKAWKWADKQLKKM